VSGRPSTQIRIYTLRLTLRPSNQPGLHGSAPATLLRPTFLVGKMPRLHQCAGSTTIELRNVIRYVLQRHPSCCTLRHADCLHAAVADPLVPVDRFRLLASGKRHQRFLALGAPVVRAPTHQTHQFLRACQNRCWGRSFAMSPSRHCPSSALGESGFCSRRRAQSHWGLVRAPGSPMEIKRAWISGM